MMLSEEALRQLQCLVPWRDASRLRDGRILGRQRKDHPIVPFDWRIRLLLERVPLHDQTVLELGSCEGVHTLQLASACKFVVGIDARVQNVVCGLVRLWAHGVENACLVLGDVEELTAEFGRFDLICHIGVLYHLRDPVRHLVRLRGIAETLFLDTHYGTPDQGRARSDVEHDGQTYEAYRYRERRYRSDPFSGMDAVSRWLSRDALLRLVRKSGCSQVDILDERVERNGPRITVLARR